MQMAVSHVALANIMAGSLRFEGFLTYKNRSRVIISKVSTVTCAGISWKQKHNYKLVKSNRKSHNAFTIFVLIRSSPDVGHVYLCGRTFLTKYLANILLRVRRWGNINTCAAIFAAAILFGLKLP